MHEDPSGGAEEKFMASVRAATVALLYQAPQPLFHPRVRALRHTQGWARCTGAVLRSRCACPSRSLRATQAVPPRPSTNWDATARAVTIVDCEAQCTSTVPRSRRTSCVLAPPTALDPPALLTIAGVPQHAQHDVHTTSHSSPSPPPLTTTLPLHS